MPDMTDGKSYRVVSLSNVAQVLSVGYRAGFGHWNKVGLVTASSSGTVVSPQNLGGSVMQLWGHCQSLSAQLTGMSPA